MKDPTQVFIFLVKESVQELFHMKKSSQEVLNQIIKRGFLFNAQLGIPDTKAI